jgi:hypothetical protein
MKNQILIASGFILQQFLDMMLRTKGSFYWRKFGVFRCLDHQEHGDELWAMWLDRTGRQCRWSFCGLLGMGMRRKRLESWCVVEGGVQASFYRSREGERGHE